MFKIQDIKSLLHLNFNKILLNIVTCVVLLIFIWQIFIYHKQSTSPFPYNWCLFWGTFEGSFLLFLCFFAIIATLSSQKNTQLITIFLPIVLALFAYLLFFSEYNLSAIKIAPILQDTLMVLHPPFLYAGFASTLVPYGHTLTNNKNYFWPRLSWVLLTIGLGLGSLWAYLELGWGGFWFWDPVENLALIPWLLMTAYIHSMKFTSAINLILAMGAFLTSMIALFFIRSGLLTSLHSFAFDMEKSLGLSIVIVFIIFFSSILAYRHLKTQIQYIKPILPVFMWQNFLIIMSAATLLLTVLIPIFYPHLSFSINFYQNLYLPLLLSVLALLVWYLYKTKNLRKYKSCLTLNLLIILLALHLMPNLDFKGVIALSLGISLVVSHIYFYLIKKNLSMTISHMGMGLMVIGITSSSYLEQTIKMPLSINHQSTLGSQTFRIEKFNTTITEHLMTENAIISSLSYKINLKPKRIYYLSNKIILPDPSVVNHYLDHYYSILEEENKGQLFVTITHKPYINLLWLGIILMILGAIVKIVRKQKFFKITLTNH